MELGAWLSGSREEMGCAIRLSTKLERERSRTTCPGAAQGEHVPIPGEEGNVTETHGQVGRWAGAGLLRIGLHAKGCTCGLSKTGVEGPSKGFSTTNEGHLGKGTIQYATPGKARARHENRVDGGGKRMKNGTRAWRGILDHCRGPVHD